MEMSADLATQAVQNGWFTGEMSFRHIDLDDVCYKTVTRSSSTASEVCNTSKRPCFGDQHLFHAQHVDEAAAGRYKY